MITGSNLLTIEGNAAGELGKAEQGLHDGGFTSTIGPNQADNFSGRNGK